jgi:hypothetical protein
MHGRSNTPRPSCPHPARLARLLLPILLGVQRGPPAGAEQAPPPAPAWDTFSDTWVATDALGRKLPGFEECGPPRADRTVGIFYFLWLGAHVNGGPYDITKILARDPEAMRKKDSPLWGPLHAPHHWGESIFGYYLTDDPFVLRKHAQMLSDAGVDAVIFDVTNQFTYKREYLALLRVFAEVRRDGGRAPQVAFLCPFWDPGKVVAELWRDLYQPGLYPELWFRWEGKPLILADPARIADEPGSPHNTPAALDPGHTLGQSFTAGKPFEAVGGSFPTWRTADAAMTLSLYRDGPKGERLARQRFEKVEDNAWLALSLTPALPAGTYYLEMSEPSGKVGWWSHTEDVLPKGQAFADGAPVPGDRTLRVRIANERQTRIREFFTFRKPQPDYFRGPAGPGMWGWLEVYPQHVFMNSKGEKEQMTAGVAQNAVGGRLGSMSEPEARGRSFHGGKFPTDPNAVCQGLNFAEQWERALKEDPRFIFVTGWNEWIAGRFAEFNGVKAPVMFVDQFDQEHSRDIEPMKGGHGDDYYGQLVSQVRRYKGVRKPPSAGPPKTIRLDAAFEQWKDVAPEFRDDLGDTAHRDHPGYNHCARYVNTSGRNDFVALKVAQDARNVYFYARAREPLTPCTDPQWMLLLIDADGDHKTGWEGYDFVVNRTVRDAATSTVERHAGGWKWEPVGEVKFAVAGNELHLAIPRQLLGLDPDKGPLAFDFKWADNVPPSGDILDFITQGDVAPNGRFKYRYRAKEDKAP